MYSVVVFVTVSRVFVLAMGFAVSTTVTGVCLLVHSSVAAVVEYRKYRKELSVITNILVSVVVTVIYIYSIMTGISLVLLYVGS